MAAGRRRQERRQEAAAAAAAAQWWAHAWRSAGPREHAPGRHTSPGSPAPRPATACGAARSPASSCPLLRAVRVLLVLGRSGQGLQAPQAVRMPVAAGTVRQAGCGLVKLQCIYRTTAGAAWSGKWRRAVPWRRPCMEFPGRDRAFVCRCDISRAALRSGVLRGSLAAWPPTTPLPKCGRRWPTTRPCSTLSTWTSPATAARRSPSWGTGAGRRRRAACRRCRLPPAELAVTSAR